MSDPRATQPLYDATMVPTSEPHTIAVLLSPKSLTPGEETSLEKVGEIRGYAGQLRSAIRDAYDNTTPGTVAHRTLGQALAIPVPEGS